MLVAWENEGILAVNNELGRDKFDITIPASPSGRTAGGGGGQKVVDKAGGTR